MPNSKLFWFTALSTILFLGMYIYGFELLNIVLALIIINIMILKASQDEVFKRFSIGNVASGRIDKIEEIMLDLTKFMRHRETGSPSSSKMEDITLGGIENSFKRQGEILKADMDQKLDRMAKKAVDIENRLNDLKKTFSAAVASLDDRIHTIEGPEKTEEAVDSEGFVELPEEFN